MAAKYLPDFYLPDSEFQSLRRDSSSGRQSGCSWNRWRRWVSISQARFLKWPHVCFQGGTGAFDLVSISQARFLKWPPFSALIDSSSRSAVSISQARFLKWPPLGLAIAGRLAGVSISQARFLKWPPGGPLPGCSRFEIRFNLSGEIPQVAAEMKAIIKDAQDLFQSLRRDSSSGRAARLQLPFDALDGFNLSGEIPQVAAGAELADADVGN